MNSENRKMFEAGLLKCLEVNSKNSDLKNFVNKFCSLEIRNNSIIITYKHKEEVNGFSCNDIAYKGIGYSHYPLEEQYSRFNINSDNCLLEISFIQKTTRELYSFYFEGNPSTVIKVHDTLKMYLTSNDNYKKNCFVATVIYEDIDSYEVRILREWRDEVLQNYYLGRVFIKYYYKFGKKISETIEPHTRLRILIKQVLDRFIKKYIIKSN